jgi:hypothetical protein
VGLTEELQGWTNFEEIECSSSSWLDAYLQPEFQYIRNLLKIAGCTRWIETLREGIANEDRAMITAKIEIRVDSSEIESRALDEIVRFAAILRSFGCYVNYSLGRTGPEMVKIDNAPAGYSFTALK